MNTAFENKIRKSACQFSLQPEEATWNKIAVAIKKQNRRRFLLWWIFSGVIITGGFAGIYFNIDNDESAHQDKSQSLSKVELKQSIQENAETNILFKREAVKTEVKPKKSNLLIEKKKDVSAYIHSPVKHKNNEGEEVISENVKTKDDELKINDPLTVIDEKEEEIVLSTFVIAESSSDSGLQDSKIVTEDDSSKTMIGLSFFPESPNIDSLREVERNRWRAMRLSLRAGVFGGAGNNFYLEDTQYKTIADFRENHGVQGTLSYTYELTVNYHITKNIQVSAGVGYHKLNIENYNRHPLYKVDTIFSSVSGPLNYQLHTVPSSGLIDSSGGFIVKEQFNYLQFPVAFGGGSYIEEVGIHLSIPFGPALLMSSEYYQYDFDRNRYVKIKDSRQLRKLNMFLGVSCDVNCNFSKSLGVYLGWDVRTYLFPLQTRESLLKYTHAEYGLKAGLIYYIK